MISKKTALKAAERWKEGGAFSFRVSDITYVIDPSQTLFVIQHDLTIKYGRVLAVRYAGLAEDLRIDTVNGTLSFQIDG